METATELDKAAKKKIIISPSQRGEAQGTVALQLAIVSLTLLIS